MMLIKETGGYYPDIYQKLTDLQIHQIKSRLRNIHLECPEEVEYEDWDMKKYHNPVLLTANISPDQNTWHPLPIEKWVVLANNTILAHPKSWYRSDLIYELIDFLIKWRSLELVELCTIQQVRLGYYEALLSEEVLPVRIDDFEVYMERNPKTTINSENINGLLYTNLLRASKSYKKRVLLKNKRRLGNTLVNRIMRYKTPKNEDCKTRIPETILQQIRKYNHFKAIWNLNINKTPKLHINEYGRSVFLGDIPSVDPNLEISIAYLKGAIEHNIKNKALGGSKIWFQFPEYSVSKYWDIAFETAYNTAEDIYPITRGSSRKLESLDELIQYLEVNERNVLLTESGIWYGDYHNDIPKNMELLDLQGLILNGQGTKVKYLLKDGYIIWLHIFIPRTLIKKKYKDLFWSLYYSFKDCLKVSDILGKPKNYPCHNEKILEVVSPYKELHKRLK